MNSDTNPGATAVQSAFKRSWLPLVGFFAIAIVIAVLTIRVFLPFATPILLAGILVSFTYPTYERVRARLSGRSGVAAAVMLLGLTLVVVIPVALMVMLLVQQASGIVVALQETDVQQKIDSLQLESRLDAILSRIPGVDVKKVSIGSLGYAAVKSVSGFVAAQGGNIFGSILDLVVGFFMMLLAATWLYTDGKQLVSQLEELSPLRRNQTREIFGKVRSVIDATLRGQVLTALAQGTVTGIGCAITGVPGSILWGAVAAVTSLVPMVGASLVWIPAAAYLAFTGGLDWRVIFLLLWGVLVVGTIDNVIRPWAMKGGTAMSGIVLIFSILGGMQVFGIIGLLMGPLMLVLFVTVIGFYREMFLDDIQAAER